MTEKRFTLSQNGTLHTVRDNVENKPLGVFEFRDNEFPAYACFHMIIDLMNDLSEDNEQLKKTVNNLKDTIIKITIAYQRKYDRTIVDLVDEIHDENISDLIKELQK